LLRLICDYLIIVVVVSTIGRRLLGDKPVFGGFLLENGVEGVSMLLLNPFH
jgi:hypothetical protein